MKIKVKEKELKKSFKKIYCIGYCNLKMLEHLEPDFYTCGVYGWNCDVYKIDCNTLIATGYRIFGEEVPKKIVNDYNDIYKELLKENLNYKELKEKIKVLLNCMIVTIKEEEKKNQVKSFTCKIDTNICKCYLYKSRFTNNACVRIEMDYNKQQASTQFNFDLLDKKYYAFENEWVLTERQKNMLEKKILKMWGDVVNEN